MTFDLTAVAPVKTEAPVREHKGGTGRTARDNSLVEGWLKELDATRPAETNDAPITYSAEARKLEKVPAEAFAEVRTRLIQAAEKLEIGVSITPTFWKGSKKVAAPEKGEKVTDVASRVDIVYVTKTRTKRPNKKTVQSVTGHETVEESREAVQNGESA